MQRSRISALMAVLALFIPALGCQAQVNNADEQIAGAVLPAPEELRDGVTVYGYDTDGNLVTLREGTNEMICLADQPGDDRFHTSCYHKSLEPYMARGRELRAQGMSSQDALQARHEEADAGTLPMPSEPAAVFNVGGPLDSFDPATAQPSLYALYIPYATQATTGITEAPGPAGTPWIMRPGTASAHIMIVPPRD